MTSSPALAGYCPIYTAADQSSLELGRPVDTNITITDAKHKELVCEGGRMLPTAADTWEMSISCPKAAGPESLTLDTPDKDRWPTRLVFREVEYSANC